MPDESAPALVMNGHCRWMQPDGIKGEFLVTLGGEVWQGLHTII
ncbi:MAG TPA: hypothetical protein VJ350_00030 [Methanoregula sp.]|nr:hypothetical protein [Methanoregula sp.]